MPPNAVALTADICIFHNYIAIAQRTKPNPCFWEIKFPVDSGYAIILCWVGSKDQFCEIKFAFDSGFAIILCWPLVIIPFYRPWPRDSGPTRAESNIIQASDSVAIEIRCEWNPVGPTPLGV